MKNYFKNAGERLLPLLFWLLVWQFAAMIIGQELLLASPLKVFSRMDMIFEESFWWTVGMSLHRTGQAYLIGIVLACLLAVACFLNRWADRLIRPMLSVIRATPVASFIILALVWLSSSQVPVLAGILMVVPVVFANVREGLESVDPHLLEMAFMFRFGKWKKWKYIMIPSVIPTFGAACEACVGLCLKATVAAEVIGVPKKAIGSMLYSSKVYLETDALLAWTLIVICLSILVEKAVRRLMKKGVGHVHHS